MVQAIGSAVLKLVRTGIGGLRIGDLQIGKYRELTGAEVKDVSRSAFLFLVWAPQRESMNERRKRSTGLGCGASNRAAGCVAGGACGQGRARAGEKPA